MLRAKIDMASGNLNLRDPVIYRILKVPHHRTGDAWCIYPTYDFAQGQSDSIERVTHSICTTEFEDHRPLYDWLLDSLGLFHPQQIEFARRNLSHTVMSKRMLLQARRAGRPSTVGTTRGCPRFRGCAGGGTRPSRSGHSASRSGSPSGRTSSTPPCCSTASART